MRRRPTIPEQSVAIDPNAVAIGDTLNDSYYKRCLAVGVTGVHPSTRLVKVYTPTMRHTLHRWVHMAHFDVHIPNTDLSSKADREAWLNDTLPQGYRITDDGRQELEYVITDDGRVDRQPA